MKNKIFKTITITILITIFSCQDVVDVDLKTSKERLVIEALIKWENGTTGNEQTIKLSKTSSFYNNQIIPATGANIVIKNLNTQQEFDFLEVEDGIYKTTLFIPEINTEYELEVGYNNEVYKATSTLLEAPEIQNITQSIEEGFSTEDPEINVWFQDFENQTDHYRISFIHYNSNGSQEERFNFIFNDSFQQNNLIKIFYESEDFKPNDQIHISMYKITERFFNFLNKLEQLNDSESGPFSVTPANVKGNIVNKTKQENYPYGYFSLNKFSKQIYTFQ